MPFGERIDHKANNVTYVATPNALHSIPSDAAAVTTVSDLTEAPRIVRHYADRFGPPRHIVSRAEYDLLPAAELRLEFGIEGDLPETLYRFRDKASMGRTLAEAGVPVLALAETDDITDVRTFAEVHGYPVIVKPRLGATSRDIVLVRAPHELTLVPDLSAEPFLVQAYCPDSIGHADGIWTGDELGAWRASQYIGTCLTFASGGQILGSVELDDDEILSRIADLATTVCQVLSAGMPRVFHLEFFLGTENDGSPRVQFLEVAARPGGTEIGQIWRDIHGYDLLGASLDMQLLRPIRPHTFAANTVGGFLIVRPPIAPPCMVTSTQLDRTSSIDACLYDSDLPAVGSIVVESIGYTNVGAVFRYRGASNEQVWQAISDTLAGFRMDCLAVVD